ncbi:type III-A CRISPR-associated RAMP protein Csm3 [Desulfobacca acetoxidans]
MQLKGIKQIKGTLTLKSGLHIGAGDMEMRIGGLDNPVIKHPHTMEPYIPGSSLKGKVRSLLEMKSGLMVRTKGAPVSGKIAANLQNEEKAEAEKILKIFGCSGADSEENIGLGPTRVSFADCPLKDAWKKAAIEKNLPFTEVKSENSIDRITGTAQNPRFTERVPASTEFDFSVTLKELGDEPELFDYLLLGLKLLELDALGGSGSRGYGRLEFYFEDPAIQEAFAHITPF